MAKIDIVTADLQALSSKMKQAEANVGKARMLVSMAQSSLNMQVASKSSISSRLDTAKRKLTTQRTGIGKMVSLTNQAAEAFERADKGSGRIVEDLFDNLFRMLGKMADSVKNFIQSIVLEKHNQVAGIFLPAGSILTGSVISGLLGPSGESGSGHTSGGGKHNTINNAGNGKPNSGSQPGHTSSTGNTSHTSNTGMTAEQKKAAEEARAKKLAAEKKQTLNEINTRYKNLPNSVNKTGFKGKCSALTFQQLNALGIVKKNTGESAAAGKDYASVLAKKGKTSTGYTCTGYEGNDALDKLLAANQGKLPITNIVCSFKKGGNITSEKYGHAMLISKIDEAGNVYFVDNTSKSKYKAVCISLEEFKAYYFKKGSKCSGITHLHK